jgi:diguanylate cyclase (GGDEF)-like protein
LKNDSMDVNNETMMFAVLLLDLNHFKSVNDSLGHHVGDELLQQVARRLESNVRSADLVARMSGDEFTVLLESVNLVNATARAKHIAVALAAPYQLSTHTVISGASIGVVGTQAAFATTDDYLRAADSAMYQAKGSGLGVHVFNAVTGAKE